MFDKTTSYPPADSLREALFLTVWLRRQELDAKRMALLALSTADIIGQKDASRTAKGYSEYLESAFPFAAKERGKTDQEMIEVMKKETEKGVVHFHATEQTPLRRAAKRMSMPDDFRQKLQERARRR